MNSFSLSGARTPHIGNMRRWHWVVISVLAGVVLLVAIGWPRPEPEYQGRTLSAWLKGFESEVAEARWQSADAVRHIGTNALPLLRTRLGQKPSIREPQWKQKLRAWLSKQSFFKINLPRPTGERREALAALDALGPAAKDAVPSVEMLLYEKPPDPQALLVLARLGPEAVPALTRALTNDQKVIRLGARACLDMLRSRSEVLFPKTPQGADFTRRTCAFNLMLMRAAFANYRTQHPEQFSADRRPRPSLPPGFTPREILGTNQAEAASARTSPGYE